MSDEGARKSDLLSHFQAITGVDTARAKFYLEASNWEMQPSLDNFFSGDPSEPSEAPRIETAPKSTSQGESSRFRSMRDVLAQQENDSDSDDDRRGQEFFAGGSERSGQVITGPPRKKVDPKSLAQSVFDAGKGQGAKTVEEEKEEMRRMKEKAFRGTGYRLGETEEDTVKVEGKPVPQIPQKKRQSLTFWKNGFTVDDGPLRDGNSEADKLFIQSIKKGLIPRELVSAAQGGEVDLDVKDQRQADYEPPARKAAKAFAGEGRKLGNPVPEIVSSSQSAASAAVNPAVNPVHVDESQPVTTLQIRLGNGSRLTQKFNHNHRVRDIRAVIDNSAPGSSRYVLMTTFPSKELVDEDQSLAEAKLLNAVVVQRYK